MSTVYCIISGRGKIYESTTKIVPWYLKRQHPLLQDINQLMELARGLLTLCRLTLSAVNDIGARLRDDLIDKLGILTLSIIAVDGIINGCRIIC